MPNERSSDRPAEPALISNEPQRVEVVLCAECDEPLEPIPMYECSSCGTFLSDDGNRCPECHRFASRIGDACQICEEIADGNLPEIRWVAADGSMHHSKAEAAEWDGPAARKQRSDDRAADKAALDESLDRHLRQEAKRRRNNHMAAIRSISGIPTSALTSAICEAIRNERKLAGTCYVGFKAEFFGDPKLDEALTACANDLMDQVLYDAAVALIDTNTGRLPTPKSSTSIRVSPGGTVYLDIPEAAAVAVALHETPPL